MTEEEQVRQAENRLDLATRHLLLMPVFPATEADVDDLKARLLSEYKVQLWATPYRGASGLPIIYAIKARGIYHDIKKLHRQQTAEMSLEFWIVQITGQDWAGITDRVEFKIVNVDEAGMRHIVLTYQQFQTAISLEDGRVLHLPVDDADFLYQLDTTGFPEHFRESGLSEIEIYIDEDGQYQRR